VQKPAASFFVPRAFLAGFLTRYLHRFVFAAAIFSCSLEFETLENVALNVPDGLLLTISFLLTGVLLNLRLVSPLTTSFLILPLKKIIYCMDHV